MKPPREDPASLVPWLADTGPELRAAKVLVPGENNGTVHVGSHLTHRDRGFKAYLVDGLQVPTPWSPATNISRMIFQVVKRHGAAILAVHHAFLVKLEMVTLALGLSHEG